MQKDYPYFSELMNISMMEDKKSTSKLISFLDEKGIKTSKRNIERYRNGTYAPSWKNARAILEYLEIEIDDDTLSIILEQTKNKGIELRKKQKTVCDPVYINFDKMTFGIGTKDVIRQRIVDIYGKEESINKYITDLIERDLNCE